MQFISSKLLGCNRWLFEKPCSMYCINSSYN